MLGALSSTGHAQSIMPHAPSIALFYGMQPPVEQLSAFDVAVVDPDANFDPQAYRQSPTAWFAYVSLGEVNPHRAYFKAVPKAWMPSVNEAWASHVVDQTAPGWPAFVVERVITPLWRKGYRGFFLDTLDSYQLIAHTDAARAAQQAGLIKVIRAIKARYPSAQLIFNRGFEVLPQVHDLAYVVAFESLYRGWNASKQAYVEVSQADRDWLMGQAKTVEEQYRLPVLAIDYCDPADDACKRETVAKITADGLIPYITDGALATVGMGAASVNGTQSLSSPSLPETTAQPDE